MAEAALWADDALMVGTYSVREPPSSIALAIYVWAKRDKEHQTRSRENSCRSGTSPGSAE